MNNLIEKLVKNFNEIEPEDNKPIKMAIMEFDKEYFEINKFGIDTLNDKLKDRNLKLVFHPEFCDGLKCFTLQVLN